MSAAAYRTGGSTAPAAQAHMFLCARCGATLVAAEHDVEVRCGVTCGPQAVCRPEDEAPRELRLSLVRDVSGPGHDVLQLLAREVGHYHPLLSLTLRVDGVLVTVTLDIDSGVPRGLTYTVETHGLVPMTLSSEDEDEVEAKRAGVSREVQLDDPAFDEAVYIDSPAADADVRLALSSPATRAAVRQLVLFEKLEIEPHAIKTRSRLLSLSELKAQLAALRVVAGTNRPWQARPIERGLGDRLGWPLASVALASPLVPYAAYEAYAPIQPWPLVVTGLGLGLILAAATKRLVTPLLSGRSNSHEEIRDIGCSTLFAFPPLTLALLLAANVWLDRSPAQTERVQVQSIAHDDGHSWVNVKLSGGVETKIDVRRFTTVLQIQDTLLVTTRRGALGQRWISKVAWARDAEGP